MSLPEFNFTYNTSTEAVKESSGGSFIGSSGVYPVTINFVSFDQTKNGGYTFNVNCNYNGNAYTFYGPNIINNDGKPNDIGARLLNKLGAVVGCTTGDKPQLEEEVHNVGRDNEARTFIVATEYTGAEVQIQIKETFDKYKGEIKGKSSDRLKMVNFFSMEGATADELAAKAAGNPVTIGTQLAKILENESTTAYKLGKDENGQPVTDAEVLAFKESKKSGKPTTGTPRQEAPAAPRKNLFAAK